MKTLKVTHIKMIKTYVMACPSDHRLDKIYSVGSKYAVHPTIGKKLVDRGFAVYV